MKRFSFYSRTDSSQEAIDTTRTFNRLAAAKYFAERKHLTLKNFLGLFGVTR